MKTIFTLSFLVLALSSFGQTILLIDDNDNITDNSDSLILALDGTIYSTYDYHNIATIGSNPDASTLANYDVVIWYASTDGANLGFWDNGVAGDLALQDYLDNGGRLWVIGTDILYSGGYATGTSFTAGDFVYDYMQLESYNAQAFGDDGGIGLSEVLAISGAPSYFPTSLDWFVGAAWWADAVTAQTGATNLYEMGPSSYPLYQEVCMFHFNNDETNVLSTFFDPGLITNLADRSLFLEKSIFYLLNFDLGVADKKNELNEIYPNPAQDQIEIKGLGNSDYSIQLIDAQGSTLKTFTESTLNIENLTPGIYFVRINSEKGTSTSKFIKK